MLSSVLIDYGIFEHLKTMQSQMRYDESKRLQQQQPPIKTTTMTMDEILEVINQKRDDELRRCDQISDEGEPSTAFEMRLMALRNHTKEVEYLMENMDPDGSLRGPLTSRRGKD
jgi:hypothetical protein